MAPKHSNPTNSSRQDGAKGDLDYEVLDQMYEYFVARKAGATATVAEETKSGEEAEDGQIKKDTKAGSSKGGKKVTLKDAEEDVEMEIQEADDGEDELAESDRDGGKVPVRGAGAKKKAPAKVPKKVVVKEEPKVERPKPKPRMTKNSAAKRKIDEVDDLNDGVSADTSCQPCTTSKVKCSMSGGDRSLRSRSKSVPHSQAVDGSTGASSVTTDTLAAKRQRLEGVEPSRIIYGNEISHSLDLISAALEASSQASSSLIADALNNVAKSLSTGLCAVARSMEMLKTPQSIAAEERDKEAVVGDDMRNRGIDQDEGAAKEGEEHVEQEEDVGARADGEREERTGAQAASGAE